MKIKDYETIHFLFFIGICFWVVYSMFLPFAHAVLFGLIMASASLPASELMRRQMGLSPQVAALIVCVTLLLTIVLPCVFMLVKLSEEILQAYAAVESLRIETVLENLNGLVHNYMPDFLADHLNLKSIDAVAIKGIFLKYSETVSVFVVGKVNTWVGDLLSTALHFLISMLVVFAVLSEGDKIKEFFVKLMPLSPENAETFIQRVKQVNNMNLMSNGLGGLLQGTLAGLVMMFVGSDSVLLLTAVMTLLAFIPLVGISFVYIPYAIYLLINQRTFDALIVIVCCSVIALVVENVYKPRYIGKRVGISSTLLIFSMIGGMGLFNLPGLFYGPVVIAIFLFLAEIFHQTFNDNFDDKSNVYETGQKFKVAGVRADDLPAVVPDAPISSQSIKEKGEEPELRA